MGYRFLALSLGVLLGCAVSFAQTPTQEQLDALKNLPQDQQDALLQGVLGKGDGTGTKVDPKLRMPQTIQNKTDLLEGAGRKLEKTKTADGRTLRLSNEDPELR